MRASLVASVVFFALSSQPIAAFAQERDCPAGDWFCSTNDAVPPTPAPAPERASAPSSAAPPESSPPPVVIIIVREPEVESAPAPQAPAPEGCFVVTKPKITTPKQKTSTSAQPTTKQRNKGGFDFYAQHLSFLGSQTLGAAVPDASLVGGGGSLRLFPRRNLEVQVGNSGMFGRDLNGFDRSEIGLTFHLARHFNPESRLRFSSITGATLSYGYVTSDKPSPLLPKESNEGAYFASYGVLAGQAGLSAELRLVPSLSVHFDILASLRWRFASTKDAPEYIDRTTNTATYTYPGVLLRGGVSFW